MEEGDGETMYAYYALHKFRWPPSKFLNLPVKEKALVIEMIDERIRAEEKARKEAERRSKRKR